MLRMQPSQPLEHSCACGPPHSHARRRCDTSVRVSMRRTDEAREFLAAACAYRRASRPARRGLGVSRAGSGVSRKIFASDFTAGLHPAAADRVVERADEGEGVRALNHARASAGRSPPRRGRAPRIRPRTSRAVPDRSTRSASRCTATCPWVCTRASRSRARVVRAADAGSDVDRTRRLSKCDARNSNWRRKSPAGGCDVLRMQRIADQLVEEIPRATIPTLSR